MGENRHSAIMLDAPAPPPPAITAPAAREISFGLVAGTAPAGTRRIVVHVGARVAADAPLRGRTFSLHVPLAPGTTSIRVTAFDGRNRRSSRVVAPVYGLPAGAEPRDRSPTLDPALDRALRALVRRHGGSSGVYVQDLRTGRGAAWNARARFPGASALKLAIAVTVLRALDAKPEAGTQVDRLLHAMLVNSDNDAANALEVWLAGSTSGGSDRVNETMQALGLTDTLMYGGYEVERRPASGAPIPIRVESQPAWGIGKYSTASDLARLARALYLAGAGKGQLLRLGVTGAEARYLLWVLADVPDRGKLGRFLGPSTAVLHKAGWIPGARHDNGIVAFAGGAFVACVMTWQTPGADELAGRVAAQAFERFGS
jgi:beta-lactamase class A